MIWTINYYGGLILCKTRKNLSSLHPVDGKFFNSWSITDCGCTKFQANTHSFTRLHLAIKFMLEGVCGKRANGSRNRRRFYFIHSPTIALQCSREVRYDWLFGCIWGSKRQFNIFHEFASVLVQRRHFLLSIFYEKKNVGNSKTLIFPCRRIKFHQRRVEFAVINEHVTCAFNMYLLWVQKIGHFQYHFGSQNIFLVNPTSLNFDNFCGAVPSVPQYSIKWLEKSNS